MSKVTSNAVAGGFGTSEEVSQAARWTNADLDAIESKLDAIVKDEETSPEIKLSFLQDWSAKIDKSADHHIGNMQVSVDERRAEQDAQRGEPVPAHVALLMANSVRDADPLKRGSIVASDQRYIDLLSELPAAAVGLTNDEHTKLLSSAKRMIGMGDLESAAAGDQLSADTQCLEELKTRRKSLAEKARKLAEKNKITPAAAAKQSQLYRFD